MSDGEAGNVVSLSGERVRSTPVERAWTVADVCQFTGMGKTWVYEQVASRRPGGLPFKRIGSRIRFDPDEVRGWWKRLGSEGSK
ncbi:helix-turn-helix domain-containing protein [Corallococcus sp. ZKHCc1 1396]|uniref:Helix-turn-helix domain-containing protein n=1 Tax=Corallococcus soli TaxID=2710757 RepID=A0ABR9PIR1_9BACT|nr:helix-turn-helix domain-containing protein [Corallococcus soli]MBE4747795.1 helix-turn-helix domain-containing protein [Corallococcus soli]